MAGEMCTWISSVWLLYSHYCRLRWTVVPQWREIQWSLRDYASKLWRTRWKVVHIFLRTLNTRLLFLLLIFFSILFTVVIDRRVDKDVDTGLFELAYRQVWSWVLTQYHVHADTVCGVYQDLSNMLCNIYIKVNCYGYVKPGIINTYVTIGNNLCSDHVFYLFWRKSIWVLKNHVYIAKTCLLLALKIILHLPKMLARSCTIYICNKCIQLDLISWLVMDWVLNLMWHGPLWNLKIPGGLKGRKIAPKVAIHHTNVQNE